MFSQMQKIFRNHSCSRPLPEMIAAGNPGDFLHTLLNWRSEGDRTWQKLKQNHPPLKSLNSFNRHHGVHSLRLIVCCLVAAIASPAYHSKGWSLRAFRTMRCYYALTFAVAGWSINPRQARPFFITQMARGRGGGGGVIGSSIGSCEAIFNSL